MSELDVPPMSRRAIDRIKRGVVNLAEKLYAHPKLARILQRRATTLGPEGGIDWGQAEALAFASLLTAVFRFASRVRM